MSAKPEYGIEFVNVELKFSLDLVAEDGETLSPEDLLLWVGQIARNHVKIGFGFNSNSSSMTVSLTDRGSVKQGEKPPCLTQHGKTHLSALQKCYFIYEILGRGSLDEKIINPALERREEYVEEQIAGLLKKKS